MSSINGFENRIDQELPEWMLVKDEYAPASDSGSFILKTIKMLGEAMSRIRIQKGHEKKRHLPALLKLAVLFAMILTIAISRKLVVVLSSASMLLSYLATWPPRDILNIVKTSLACGMVTLVIFAPAMIINPAGMGNNLFIVVKVLISVGYLSVFNHTTQWNHITAALRRLRVPSVVIFLLDMTLKYIVLLGNLIIDLLTSLQLRSVGVNNKKYTSIGGVMGVTFIRGAEMNDQMYEAMRCRCFTDDYDQL